MGLVAGDLSYLDLLSGSVIMTTLSLASETASGDRWRWWTLPEADIDPLGE